MFVGRKEELGQLESLLAKEAASLVVIRGRRRIGKSTLVQEFGKRFYSYFEFSGLPPERKATAQDQRDEFSRQLQRQLGIPAVTSDDWGDLFWHLGQAVQKGRILVLFDEITWMGGGDPLFLGKLKNAWDQHFKRNNRFVLVLCGSVSGWIDENILKSTGFMGRISLELVLHELPLHDCAAFWGKYQERISPHEKFKILCVTGGVPRYLEEIKPSLSAEENIRELCFVEGGILVHEFDHIFSDLFSRRAPIYKKVVSALVKGTQTREQLLKTLRVGKGGGISRYLEDLEKGGFIIRDHVWHFKEKTPSKLNRYRLKDNYLRFYLKYIEPNRESIRLGRFRYPSLGALPQWETVMGHQFENLVLNNRYIVYEKLHLSPHEVISDNPFFQKKSVQQSGCQIDYLIHSRFNTLYVCEIKFSRHPIQKEVIQEVAEKMKRLKIPKNFTIRPVLIHAGEVDEEIVESGFFDKIISFSEFLQ